MKGVSQLPTGSSSSSTALDACTRLEGRSINSPAAWPVDEISCTASEWCEGDDEERTKGLSRAGRKKEVAVWA